MKTFIRVLFFILFLASCIGDYYLARHAIHYLFPSFFGHDLFKVAVYILGYLICWVIVTGIFVFIGFLFDFSDPTDEINRGNMESNYFRY